MAIFMCNSCNHTREVSNEFVGKSVTCPKCNNLASIYDAVYFADSLIRQYIQCAQELNSLRAQLKKDEPAKEVSGNFLMKDVNIHDTNILAHNVENTIKWAFGLGGVSKKRGFVSNYQSLF